jgi:hypothetical protein
MISHEDNYQKHFGNAPNGPMATLFRVLSNTAKDTGVV